MTAACDPSRAFSSPPPDQPSCAPGSPFPGRSAGEQTALDSEAFDLNLQRLRDKSLSEIEYELQLKLDTPLFANTREERAEHVLRAAFRNVDLYGWQGAVTDDACRLHLTGGSVTLDLGLGATLMNYIEAGL